MENRLRVLRAERNWSQQDLAERLEVSRQSVNAIETGKYDPSLPLAFRIAELFDRRRSRTFSSRPRGAAPKPSDHLEQGEFPCVALCTDPRRLAAATLDWSAAAPRASAPAPAEQRLAHISIRQRRQRQPGRADPRPRLAAARCGTARRQDLARNHRLILVQVNGFAGSDRRRQSQPGMLAGVVDDLARLARRQPYREAGGRRPFDGRAHGADARAASIREAAGRLMIVDALPFYRRCCSGPTRRRMPSARWSSRCAPAWSAATSPGASAAGHVQHRRRQGQDRSHGSRRPTRRSSAKRCRGRDHRYSRRLAARSTADHGALRRAERATRADDARPSTRTPTSGAPNVEARRRRRQRAFHHARPAGGFRGGGRRASCK